jgi:hypothetical protein
MQHKLSHAELLICDNKGGRFGTRRADGAILNS